MSRWWIIPVGLVLAAVSVWGVVALTDGDEREPMVEVGTVSVVITTEDIPRGQRLNPLIERGVFRKVQVPARFLIAGTVSDISELKGSFTVTPIYENEQVTAFRLSSSQAGITD